MKILRFLIMLHVYILLLTLLITTVQLINCEYSTAHGSHDENNITLMTENNTIYTYNPKPPKALRLGKGAFGDALIGVRRVTNGITMQVAMKIEKIGRTDNNRKSIPMLHNEQRMYKIMNGQAGIPHFFDYFPNSHGKAILVIELLGKSLDSLLESKKKFSIKTSMMIGLQVLEIIEALHNRNLIYSDMKPANLAIGREDKSKIYILDFGLSTFYKKDGKHVKPSTGQGAGTPIYMSLYAHSHQTQSRRDDIESIAYLLIKFLNGKIWSTNVVEDIIHEKSTRSFKKIAGRKCSKTMVAFLKYARGLNFTDTPDYGYLRGLLQDELAKYKLINDGHFDWMESSTGITTAEVSQSPNLGMNSVQEQSNEIANKMPPMNVLVATNNQNSLISPLIVQHPHIQNVLLGQTNMIRPTNPIIHSIPSLANVLPTSFAVHQQLHQQIHQQHLQHLTPNLVQ